MKAAIVLLRRILMQTALLLLLYFLSRCCFTAINLRHFQGLNLTGFLRLCYFAVRYDVSSICSLNGLLFFAMLLPLPFARKAGWQRLCNVLFVVINGIALLFEISDWAYFPFAFKRSAADVLSMVSRKGDFLNLLPAYLVDYWYVLPAWVAFVFLLWWCNRRIIRKNPMPAGQSSLPQYAAQGLVWALVCGALLLGIRGGFQYIPIGLRNAVQVTESKYVPIVLNTPFSIISSATTPGLQERIFFPESEAWQAVQPVHAFSGKTFQKKNVVVIILESFSKEFTAQSGGLSYTPFLDSLAAHSINCTNAWANGLHSAEGIPAIIAGIPTLMEEPFATSSYGTNQITSLPGLLHHEGYSTAFFHGGTNGTMSFDVFAAAAGFQQYFGRKEYHGEQDYDGAWGIYDGPFLQYFSKQISALPQPFCTALFTLSSHPPYSIPQNQKQKFPAGTLPVHQTIRYTDDALQQFFKTAESQAWYGNTLFIITADHCAPATAGGYWESDMGRYAIPLLYFSPDGITAPERTDATLTQQIDILPTTLDLLGYNKPFFAFGKSLLRESENHFAINWHSGSYQWLAGSGVLQLQDTAVRGFFAFPADSMLHHNLLRQPQLYQNDLRNLKAFLQVYTSALLHNRMTAK